MSPLGEAGWIRAVRAAFAAVGAYDPLDDERDAHLLSPRSGLFLNVDAHVAGRHYPWPCPRPRDAGFRGVAAAVSDLAAVGAVPADLFLSLAWNADTPPAFLQLWIDGMAEAAAVFGLRLRGGNLSRADLPAAHSVVTGAGQRRAARGPLRAGDLLWLTGTHGDAALALALDPVAAAPAGADDLARRFWRPEPRLQWGRWLWRRSWVAGVSDVSDGWLSTLDAMPRAGGLLLDPAAVPRSAAFNARFRDSGESAAAFWGGEDWELAFATRGMAGDAAQRRLHRAGIAATLVGEVTAAPGVAFLNPPAVACPARFGYDCLTSPA